MNQKAWERPGETRPPLSNWENTRVTCSCRQNCTKQQLLFPFPRNLFLQTRRTLRDPDLRFFSPPSSLMWKWTIGHSLLRRRSNPPSGISVLRHPSGNGTQVVFLKTNTAVLQQDMQMNSTTLHLHTNLQRLQNDFLILE